jgi:NAD(P)-dependent dehydrogenase (short-subunit alcohol dehydrogenase family)
MKRLEGKSALVTGAASGIGRATSILFAQHGASVVCVDRAEGVEAFAEAIRKAGGRAVALNKDVSKEADVAEAIAAAVKHHGGLDICYANAGVSGGLPNMDELTIEDWHRVVDVNLVGAFLTVKHAARVMVKAKHGSIICTASVAGLRSGAGGITYSASKAGVISLVQTIANQLAGTGVRVNAICPGLIETGMTKPLFDRARERGSEHKIGQLNPLRRYGRPEEIAGAALFLASDDSSYVNGIALPVDGGLSSSLPIVPPKM